MPSGVGLEAVSRKGRSSPARQRAMWAGDPRSACASRRARATPARRRRDRWAAGAPRARRPSRSAGRWRLHPSRPLPQGLLARGSTSGQRSGIGQLVQPVAGVRAERFGASAQAWSSSPVRGLRVGDEEHVDPQHSEQGDTTASTTCTRPSRRARRWPVRRGGSTTGRRHVRRSRARAVGSRRRAGRGRRHAEPGGDPGAPPALHVPAERMVERPVAGPIVATENAATAIIRQYSMPSPLRKMNHPILPMSDDDRHRHQADHPRRRERCEQAGGEQQARRPRSSPPRWR